MERPDDFPVVLDLVVENLPGAIGGSSMQSIPFCRRVSRIAGSSCRRPLNTGPYDQDAPAQ